MRKILSLLAIILFVTMSASAQSEAELKQYFEGRFVGVKIDMPATKDGVNVYPERAQPLNFSEYAERLKRYGTSVRRGESIMVTKIKVKDKHIEFQLGGGGYGTIGDETDASVSAPSVGKSRREKKLEEELKRENDPARRRRIKDELSDLRREREREDRLSQTIAADAAEARRARIEQKALQGGARFNVHFNVLDASVLTPRAVTEALRNFVDFSGLDEGEDTEAVSFRPVSDTHLSAQIMSPGVLRLGPPTNFLSAGLSLPEVVRLLGQPANIYGPSASSATAVTTYEFTRGGGRVLVADFVGGVLVGSHTRTPGASRAGR
jgi:hypothetical protein